MTIKTNNLLPLCKWSGGKRSEIKNFKDHYPKNFDRYIEPFAGGAAVFFDLNFKGQNVINDVHPELINFYQQIKNGHSNEIYRIIQQFGLDEKSYYKVRGGSSKLDDNDIIFKPKNDIEEAARFFYLRKTCYRGMIRYNSNGNFNIPWGRYKKTNFNELLNEEYTQLLQRTDVMFGDYKKVFEKYDNEENFCFIDQPYDSTFNDYGFDNFTRQNQTELFEIFTKTKNKCLMIVGGSEFIRELYSDYITDEYDKKYAFKIHSGRVGEEINVKHLIIKNF
jgi:DNA adenine methylase